MTDEYLQQRFGFLSSCLYSEGLGKQRSNDKQSYGTLNRPFPSSHGTALASLGTWALRIQFS